MLHDTQSHQPCRRMWTYGLRHCVPRLRARRFGAGCEISIVLGMRFRDCRCMGKCTTAICRLTSVRDTIQQTRYTLRQTSMDSHSPSVISEETPKHYVMPPFPGPSLATSSKRRDPWNGDPRQTGISVSTSCDRLGLRSKANVERPCRSLALGAEAHGCVGGSPGPFSRADNQGPIFCPAR